MNSRKIIKRQKGRKILIEEKIGENFPQSDK